MRPAILAGLLALCLSGSASPGVQMGVVEESKETEHARLKARAEVRFKAGMKALAAGDTGRAVRTLLSVVQMSRMRIDSPYPEMAFNQLKVLTGRAAKELAVARELLAGEDLEAGLKELKRIVRTYSGLWPAKQAGRLLRGLKSDPGFRGALLAESLAEDLREAQALEEEAEAILHPSPAPETEDTGAETPDEDTGTDAGARKEMAEDERQAERLEQLAEAYEIYGRVRDLGGETAPAQEAAAAIERLEKDAALMARIREIKAEREASEWLGLAMNYLGAGRLDLAREQCEKILSKHPDAPEAAEAARLIEEMK
ncbi:MAG: hypothetical protein WBC53_07710 [Phycisphaerae bacterium]